MTTPTITTAAAPPATSCARCGQSAKLKPHTFICAACRDQIVARAREAQERDYLARYLHTRADAQGRPIESTTSRERRQARRLVAEARRLGVDWTHPPKPIHFDARLRLLSDEETGREGQRKPRGRPRREARAS